VRKVEFLGVQTLSNACDILLGFSEFKAS